MDSVADQGDDNISGALDAVYRELSEAQALLKRRSPLQEVRQP